MDQLSQEEIKKHLLQTNEEFRRIADEHADYDRQIEALEAKPAVTPDDEVEEHRLKKLKLAAKDRMVEMIDSYKTQHV